MTAAPLNPTPSAGWSDPLQVAWYRERIGKLEARQAGEAMLVDVLPIAPQRVLDLGCGDGVLAALVLGRRPSVTQLLAVDRSVPMLEHARKRFAAEPRVEVRNFDMNDALIDLGCFDLIISGFAIHHLEHHRKRELFSEVAHQLTPSGLFANLEVVASASAKQHADFLAAIGRMADDPEDRLASVEEQLGWMSEAGMINVECLWRWRGFALLVGEAR